LLKPDLKSSPLDVELSAAGRYVARFPALELGNYFVSIQPGKNAAPVRVGLAVPSSPEYREHETNLPLLAALAALRPAGGEPGQILEPSRVANHRSATVNVFRHDLAGSTERQEAWHLLVFAAALLFVVDAAVRRVAFSAAGVRSLGRWLAGGRRRAGREPAADPTLERLRSLKAGAAGALPTRGRWLPDSPLGAAAVDHSSATTVAAEAAAAESGSLARLLEVKRRLHDRTAAEPDRAPRPPA
jgi:hypothetical protein